MIHKCRFFRVEIYTMLKIFVHKRLFIHKMSLWKPLIVNFFDNFLNFLFFSFEKVLTK